MSSSGILFMNKGKLYFISLIVIVFSLSSGISFAKHESFGLNIKNLADFKSLAIQEGYKAFESQHKVLLRGKFRADIFPKALAESLKNIYDSDFTFDSKEKIRDTLISNIMNRIKIEARSILQDRIELLLIANPQDYIVGSSEENIYSLYQNCLESIILGLIDAPKASLNEIQDDSDTILQLEELSNAICSSIWQTGENLTLSELSPRAIGFLSGINLESLDCYSEAVKFALGTELDDLYVDEYIDTLNFYDYTSIKFPLTMSTSSFVNVAPYAGGNFVGAKKGMHPYGFITTVVSLYLQRDSSGYPLGDPLQVIINRQIDNGKCLSYSTPSSTNRVVYDSGCFFGYSFHAVIGFSLQSIWLYKSCNSVPTDYLLSLPLKKIDYLERLWKRINETKKSSHVKSSGGIYPTSPLAKQSVGVRSNPKLIRRKTEAIRRIDLT